MSQPPLKLGYVGYGTSVRVFHLPFVSSVAEVQIYAFLQRAAAPGVDERDTSGKPHCTIDYPAAKHYRNLEAFLADEGIDVVVVCTGPSSHAGICRKAIDAGKHVEKPFTVTTAEADDLISAAERAGVTLSVYQNRRYDSDFRTLQSILPTLGTIHEAEFHHDIPDAPFINRLPASGRVEGQGMAYTAGSHIVDQALLLFGTPTSVTAFFRSLRDNAVDSSAAITEDTYTIILSYESRSLLVTLKTNPRSIMPRQMTHFVRGTQGTFLNFGNDPQLAQVGLGMKAGDEGWGEVQDEAQWPELSTKQKVDLPGIQQNEASGMWTGKVPPIPGVWADFYRDLARRIRGDEGAGVGPEIPRDGIKVLQLAWQSVQEKRTVGWQ